MTKDNSSQVPGFNGVWVQPDGKHFIKIEGEVIEADGKEEAQKGVTPLLFDTAEEAAKRRDQILKDSGRAQVSEMNYKPDGSRIIHEKETGTKSTKEEVPEVGHNVIVPALAVVNIKVCWCIFSTAVTMNNHLT